MSEQTHRKKTSHRHESNQTSGIIIVAFDLYEIDGVCPARPQTYVRVFPDIFVSVITRENRHSLLHVFPRAFDAKNACTLERPFRLVCFQVDSTSHEERKKMKK